jgi:hypothetical protein
MVSKSPLKCSGCGGLSRNPLCATCDAAFAARYPEGSEITMAKSTTGTRTRKSSKAVEAAAQRQLGEQPEPGNSSAEDLEAAEAFSAVSADDITPEDTGLPAVSADDITPEDTGLPAASNPTVDEGAAEAAEEPAPASGEVAGKYGWLKRVNADKVLRNAIAKLSDQRVTFEELGIAGIPAALQILGKAAEAMDALAKKGKAGPKNVTVGAVVKVRAKVAGDYSDVLTEEEMGAMKVKKVVGKNVHCSLDGGKVAVLPLGHLEVA